MTDAEIGRKERRRGVELDFSEPSQAEVIAGMFGGEAYLADEYPELYELFQNAKQKQSNANTDERQGFQNSAYIVDVIYDEDKKCAYAAARTYLTRKAKRLYCNLSIYKNGIEIGREMEFFRDSDNAKIECCSVNFEKPSQTVTYKGVLNVAWQPYDENVLHALQDSGMSGVVEGIGEEFVSELTVTDPGYKKPVLEPRPIRVALIRRDNSVDYEYPNAKRDENKNVAMHLKLSGKAVLSGKHTCDRPPFVDAALNKESKGTIFYNRDPYLVEIKVSSDKKTITWDLLDDWCNFVPESVIEGNRDYMFDMKLQFYCKTCGTFHQLIISSEDYPQYAKYKFYKKIPGINVLWGCLAKGTKILMADGTEKRIEEISIGDMIMSDGNKAIEVTNVISGTEETIYNLCLESGESALATITHPFYSEDGMIVLSDIKSTTRLKKQDGNYETVLYCYPEAYCGEVYSLETVGGAIFFANGIASGTHSDQGRLADRADEISAAEDPQLSAEIEKLKKDFKEGRI